MPVYLKELFVYFDLFFIKMGIVCNHGRVIRPVADLPVYRLDPKLIRHVVFTRHDTNQLVPRVKQLESAFFGIITS